ncbi:MAG: biopolymer transporter ExbD [Elusimicrobiota bacterium]
MKIKTKDEADVNVTSLIDCLMQCIIFYMVIMSAQYVFGVAIKFSPGGKGAADKAQKEEKKILVYVESDYIDAGHRIIQEGNIKLNGEEIPLTQSDNPSKWEEEKKQAFDWLQYKIGDLLKQGYKKDVLTIQADVFAYHGKIMKVIDKGKANKIDGFVLVPPSIEEE